jgi:opacity protein-like surface antigen
MLNKKRVLSVAVAGVAGLLIASSASAEGVYLGGQLGWGTTHQGGISNSELTTAIKDLNAIASSSITSNKYRDNGLAGRLFAGYDITSNFAAELGYTKFSDSTADQTDAATVFGTAVNLDAHQKVKTYAIDLVAKGTLPLQYGFSAFGKVGVAYLNQSGNATNSVTVGGTQLASETLNRSEAKFLPTFGAGVSYEITKNVSTDLSWSRIQTVGSTKYLKSTDFVGLGLSYHFS